ncbi:MAG: hypothetical protein GX073_08575 [Firmicutes bacterium]|nr:hypothetical protein [Bacillota bacterium]
MVNWNRGLMRAVFIFLVLFFLAYLVPGLSALTVTHLLAVSLLTAFLATVGENMVLADTPVKKSLLLFGVAALIIYFYAVVFVGERLSLIGVLLAAGLTAVIDYLSQERVVADTEPGVTAEGEVRAEPDTGPQE